MKIRKAAKKDFEKVYPLLKELFEKDNIQKGKTKNIYDNTIKNKLAFQLVVVEDEEVVGYSSFVMREDVQAQGKIAYLQELIIDKKLRGNGIGKKLLVETEKLAKKNGCIDLEFPSNMKRKKAHEFYKKMKYNKTSYFFWREL